MVEKQFNTRILLRYDSLENWTDTSVANIKGNLILKQGEVAIAHVPGETIVSEGRATQVTPPADLFKVGDGMNAFKDLPWASALGADIYAWAKASNIFISTSGSGNFITNIVWNNNLNDGKGGILVTKGTAANTTYQISEGTTNGTFIVDPSDADSYAVKVHGLGSIAFTSTTDYATAEQGRKADAAMPKSGGTFTGSITLVSDPTTNLEAATKQYVDSIVTNATAGLSGAMHFIGSTNDTIVDGSTQNVTVAGYTGVVKTAGNVVLSNNKEFVWTGVQWEVLGDEGSYALKTVSISAGGGLTGGGNLTQSRTISHALISTSVDPTTDAVTIPSNVSGDPNEAHSQSLRYYIRGIKRDRYGHTIDIVTDSYYDYDKYRKILVNNNQLLADSDLGSLAFQNGTGITLKTFNDINHTTGQIISINHSNSIAAGSETIETLDKATGSDTGLLISAARSYVSFPVITYDAQGHITSSKTKILKFDLDTTPSINTTITTSLVPQNATWNSSYQLNRIARTAKFAHLLQNQNDDEIILCGGNAFGFTWITEDDSTPSIVS